MAEDPPSQPELPLPFPELAQDLPLLPARMVNEYQYCPRLAYLEWVQGEWSDSADTVEGRRVHRRTDKPSGELPAPEEVGEETRIHARSITLSSNRLGLIAKMARLAGAQAGARHLEIANLDAVGLEILARDGVAQPGERRFDIARRSLERFRMPEVVLFARDGEDVRLQIRDERLVSDSKRRERAAMALAGHRGHIPDGKREERNENREDGEQKHGGGAGGATTS
jgi:antitoxin component of MazEF toxin-antitoxin module